MISTENLCMYPVLKKKADAIKNEYFKHPLDTNSCNSALIIHFSSISIRNVAKNKLQF